MAEPGDLTRRLVEAADSLGPIVTPTDRQTQLIDLCTLTRSALGAASASIARIDARELVYEAADGAGAAELTGTRLAADRGFAGYVARTGQSLVIDDVSSDPRFARDVAERVGYVPTSMIVVPVTEADDRILGVISVLDRGSGAGDPLTVTSAAARVAAPLLAVVDAVQRLGPILLRAIADAARHDDTLAASLHRLAVDSPDDDAGLTTFAALLAEVRDLPPAGRQAVERILRDALALATTRRSW